jgi:hypothetical protein
LRLSSILLGLATEDKVGRGEGQSISSAYEE